MIEVGTYSPSIKYYDTPTAHLALIFLFVSIHLLYFFTCVFSGVFSSVIWGIIANYPLIQLLDTSYLQTF
jgi:hypothetical protein